MKIALVAELYMPGFNGMITAVRGLAESLSAIGQDVTLVCPDSVEVRKWAGEHRIAIYPVLGINVPAQIQQRVGVWLPTDRRKVRHLLRKIDIVHLHTPLLTGLAIARIAREEHLPIVATNHLLPENLIAALRVVPTRGQQLLTSIIWRWIGKGLRTADVVLSPSQYGQELLRARFPGLPVKVISNGVRGPLCRPPTDANSQSSVIYPLYVGRLQREKCVDELLYAVRGCLAAGINIEFSLVGDGPDRARLESVAHQLGITSHVRFAGRVSDQVRDLYYEKATCLWMASRSELQCCAALEAMAFGLPVVAARAGALPETIREGIAGWLYAPGKVDEIVSIMGSIQQSQTLRHQVSRRATAVAAEHRLSDICENIVALYSSMLFKRRSIKWS